VIGRRHERHWSWVPTQGRQLRRGVSQVVVAERELLWTIGLIVAAVAAIAIGLPFVLDLAAAAFR
jgi:preprotein translocase subunit SecE